MTEERAPYHVGQEPTIDPVHEHLFRVAFGNTNILRFCERCERTWLIRELHDILYPNRSVYCWTEVLEEAEAREKLTGAAIQPARREEQS